MTQLKFEAHDETLLKVLFGLDKYSIPRYQRDYTWREDEVNEFWTDLTTSKEPYFLGSFIFNFENTEKTGYIEVVDGQQRILTIMIFLAALRDCAIPIDTVFSELIHTMDICIKQRDGSTIDRIKPGDTTQEYFKHFIQTYDSKILESDPKTKEQKNIKANYNFFAEKINGGISKIDAKSGKLEYLKMLRSKIEKLIVIEIKIAREDDAYEIFETTNARGVDLNVGDLVKNLVFKNMKATDDKDIAKEIWQNIVDNIQSTNTELRKFIRYYWISKYAFVTEKKLYKAIKNEITKWDEFLDSLWSASEHYNVLLQGSGESWKTLGIKDYLNVYNSVFAIRSMGVSQCYVFFLSILENYEKLGTNPTKIIKLIEKFTFVYSGICNLPGNKVEGMYSRYSKRLNDIIQNEPEKKIAAKIDLLFTELAKELRDEKPPFEYFSEQFMEVSYKDSEFGRLFIKYMLNEINIYLSPTKENSINFYNVSIEHLLPLQPDKDWHLKKSEIKPYVNLLGNLTLLDKELNSKIGNRPIAEKMQELEISTLPVTSEVVQLIKSNDLTWNQELILIRQRTLAELAYYKIWDF